MKNLCTTLLGLLICLPLGAQTTYFVNANGTGNGSSWKLASSDLHYILSIAEYGDQIWVAEGTYVPTKSKDRHASFHIKDGVQLYGGFLGYEKEITQRNWQNHQSILSGEIGQAGQHDNSYSVVTTRNVSSETVIDGFMITSGNANDDSGEGSTSRCGAGWYNDGSNGGNSSPLIINCTFVQNAAREGGAFYSNGSRGISRPVFVNCDFLDNRADLDGGALYNDSRNGGGALPVLEECLFENNLASYGAGIFSKGDDGRTSLDLRNCTFKKNTAFLWGGAIFTIGQPTEAAIQMEDCKFADNYPTDVNKMYSFTNND